MSELSFEETASKVRKLAKDPNNEEKLELYSLYKQATVGDNTTKKPGMLDFQGKAKWEAWNKKKGTTSEEAKTQYIEFAKKMFTKYN
ncbi:hypothetical protein M0813_22918 [Anaeramoeba flamelloides]|uniref:ACB domain-containing protein n=1 Tax=Anaeramoeba flamelloides TaxID=1746091 RepID=A0AAV7YSA1_9EUKA|nr:hypothetical protein M0812_21604 [Anaeramoeba flamelloides]KAJ6242145.1 hypothetical protein M0813_22918 [Anaeramoeba flamelloides]